MMNPHFSEMLSELSGAGVDYIVVGAFAIAAHGLAGIDGVSFDEAWPRRLIAKLGSASAPVLSLVDLAANKRAAGRPKDLADLAWIEDRLKTGDAG